ncbi:hypothetical protein J2046_004779 [Rhizobium petrolearium]|nr:hypothetical protein [Neorhizobium petrolearium]
MASLATGYASSGPSAVASAGLTVGAEGLKPTS